MEPGGGTSDEAAPAPIPDAPPPPFVAVDCESPSTPCSLNEPTPTPSPTDRTIPTVTLTDLASFHPQRPTLQSEPDHVAVVGLPLNLIADTATHTLHGELFGLPVSVRFTPDHYDFDYGDGTHTTTRTPGTAWAAGNDPQFTPTDTSHTYRERGTATATVTVSYRPDVNFGDGTWRPVTGYVTATSPGTQIRIYEAQTALVAHTCTENPTGPGC